MMLPQCFVWPVLIVYLKILCSFLQEGEGSEREREVDVSGATEEWLVRVSPARPRLQDDRENDVDPRRARVRSHDAQL